MEELITQFSFKKFEIIKNRSAGYIPNPEYIKSFIMTELNDTKDFISNPWLVNKFPDELNIFGLGGTLAQLSTLSEGEFKIQEHNRGH